MMVIPRFRIVSYAAAAAVLIALAAPQVAHAQTNGMTWSVLQTNSTHGSSRSAPDWRVAEFHDGWGWHFWADGAAGGPAGRVPVHINDQPANCWK